MKKMFLKIVYSQHDERISGNDYYIQIMLVGQHSIYCTFKVIWHPCKVINIKEYVFRNWGAKMDRQNVVCKVDNDTLEERSDNNVILEESKYMIIYIP